MLATILRSDTTIAIIEAFAKLRELLKEIKAMSIIKECYGK